MVHPGCNRRAGAGHRGQCHGLYLRQRRADSRPAIRRSRTDPGAQLAHLARNRNIGVSYLDFKDWKGATQTCRSLAAYTGGTMNVSDEGRVPERFSGTFVSANAFSVIGQAPVLGRDFAPADDRPGAAAVVLLGNSVWTNRYGRDPAILGRTIRVNDVPSVVIGVMPEGFRFPQNADLWQPLALVPGLETQKRDARGIDVYGRLAPDVPLEQARAEFL